jgi:hypothetical protein
VAPDDADTFNDLMGVPPQPPIVFVGENNASALTDVEGSIDVQWMRGIGQGVPTEYWSTSGEESGEGGEGWHARDRTVRDGTQGIAP